ncbi:MAG TPA: IPT/TIG domain-containing protein [Longimicrobiales bacterium]
MSRLAQGLRIAVAVAAACLSVSCEDPSGPPYPRTIAIEGDYPRLGSAGDTLDAPLRVRVTGGRSGGPITKASVSWHVVQGSGATISPANTFTDTAGVAEALLKLGPDTGLYRVEARLHGSTSAPAVFEVRAVRPPQILSITPDPAAAGSIVRITGLNLSPVPSDHTVLFSGFRGTVVGGTATELEVEVPACIPTRSVSVMIELGPVRSDSVPLAVVAEGSDPLVLDPGDAVTLSSAAELACIRLPEGPASAWYLVIARNAADVPSQDLPFQLVGLTGPVSATSAGFAPAGVATSLGDMAPSDPAIRWEARLRARERELPLESAIPPRGELGVLGYALPPQIGDRRTFQVLNKDETFTRVTAEVKYVSEHAVLYQDLKAPSGGFSAADFEALGRLFDDPIYDAVIETFGAPSDVDGDGRIIILFTPVVNEMTPPNSGTGFIAGFFYGLDLTTQANSNRAEIFYSLVPDPEAQFGNRRATSDVLRAVPPVLAHEFQHMVHFNQRFLVRNAPPEAQWLSEALAHTAEDVVAAVLRARGDGRANEFFASNLARARLYLADPGGASLINDEPPGSLEERGAQWLFIKYIMGHYGGTDLLGRLTQTTLSGVANVTSATGRSWGDLLADWSIALWADDAPELQGVALDPHFTFPELNLREEYARGDDPFPLSPVSIGMLDFIALDTLPASSMDYLMLVAPSDAPPPLHLNFAGARGAPFQSAGAQLTIVRVR